MTHIFFFGFRENLFLNSIPDLAFLTVCILITALIVKRMDDDWASTTRKTPRKVDLGESR